MPLSAVSGRPKKVPTPNGYYRNSYSGATFTGWTRMPLLYFTAGDKRVPRPVRHPQSQNQLHRFRRHQISAPTAYVVTLYSSSLTTRSSQVGTMLHEPIRELGFVVEASYA